MKKLIKQPYLQSLTQKGTFYRYFLSIVIVVALVVILTTGITYVRIEKTLTSQVQQTTIERLKQVNIGFNTFHSSAIPAAIAYITNYWIEIML